MFPIFLSNKKCRLEHVVNKLMSCLISEFLWIFSYIQTAWYSIELHEDAMAFHGTPSVLQGTPWHSMELYDIPWNSKGLQGNSMKFDGIPWNSINTSWNSMELRGIPWNSMAFHGTHGCSMEVPLNSMDFHRFPWIWNSMEVLHPGSLVFPFLFNDYNKNGNEKLC